MYNLSFNKFNNLYSKRKQNWMYKKLKLKLIYDVNVKLNTHDDVDQ